MRKQKTALFLFLFLCLSARVAAQEKDMRVRTGLPESARAESLKRDTALIASLIRKSRNYPTNDTGALLLRKAFDLSISIGYPDGAASSLLGLGTFYFNTGKLDKSMQLFRQAEPYCNNAYFSRARLLANLYSNIGSNYSVRGMHDSSIYFFYRSVKLSEQQQHPDSMMLAHAYTNLASTWLMTDQIKKAIYYLKKAETIARLSNNQAELASAYSNLAAAYSADSIKTSNDYALKALEIYRRHPGKTGEQSIYYTLGNNHIMHHEPEKAIPYFQKAIAIHSGNPMEDILKPHFGLSNAWLQLNEPRKAEASLLKALEVITANRMQDKTAFFIFSNLGDVYNALGDYRKAYIYRTRAFTLEDTLLNAEKLQASGLLEVKYRTLQKDNQLVRQQLQITQKESLLARKNIWIAAIAGVAILLVLVMVALYANNRQKQRLQLERMRTLQQEQEIGNLKSMIRGEEKERSRLARELHDGILVLFSAIKMKLRGLPKDHEGLTEAHDYQDILRQMDNATRELRRTAHNLMPDMLLDGGLAEAVYYFCSNLQQSTGLVINFQQYGDLPRLQQEFELSIYRIVQELMQNIIKHAKASKAIVQLNFRDDLLYITVEDNGIGFQEDPAAGQTGMGLRSIRNRVRALNGMMDLRTNEPSGTTMYLEFDIRAVIRPGQLNSGN